MLVDLVTQLMRMVRFFVVVVMNFAYALQHSVIASNVGTVVYPVRDDPDTAAVTLDAAGEHDQGNFRLMQVMLPMLSGLPWRTLHIACSYFKVLPVL